MDKSGLKQKIAHEALEYWIVFLYLAVFFSAFILYRKLILAEHQIPSFRLGMGLIEALLLSKVILIGKALRWGGGLEGKPLIIPTLYKAIAFSFLVGVFAVVEHAIQGLIHGIGATAGIRELINEGRDELISRCLIMFTAFVPFFAFQELGEVFGVEKVRALFFKRRKPLV